MRPRRTNRSSSVSRTKTIASSRSTRWRRRLAFAGLTLAIPLLLGGPLASAQRVVEETEELDFDRPESWAMKYFASLSLLTGMGVPENLGAGGITLGFEGGIVPRLDEDQRRVGFEGTKVEDLNRTRFFGRVRGRIGLTEDLVLELAYVPPVEIDGTKPNLFAAALGRSFSLSGSETWKLGLRGYGQIGTIEGDIICSAEEAAAGADRELNPFRCEAPSNDELTQRLLGVELTAGYGSESPLRPHVGVAISYLDLDFQLDALYSGVTDRARMSTDGATVTLLGGMTFVPAERWRLTGEVFYGWLSVVRPPSTSAENDPLLNARFLVTYRLR